MGLHVSLPRRLDSLVATWPRRPRHETGGTIHRPLGRPTAEGKGGDAKRRRSKTSFRELSSGVAHPSGAPRALNTRGRSTHVGMRT